VSTSVVKFGKPRLIVGLALALGVPLAIAAALRADDEKTRPDAKPSRLEKELIGTWVLVGTPDNIGEAPATGGRLKFFTGKHWTITEADGTGKVVFHHGGMYVIEGDEYAETIKYASEGTSDLVGKTFKFKIKVEGDRFTQLGIGNQYNEVWERAK
jgi:hypothetical protein